MRKALRELEGSSMKAADQMKKHRVYSTSIARVYPLYVEKAEKKGRTKAEVDEIICWLTGHSHKTLKNEWPETLRLRVSFPKRLG